MNKKIICHFDDCDRKALAKNYCQAHYYQLQRGGSLRPIRGRVIGPGWLDKKGYKIISVNGKSKRQHRHIMEQHLGRSLYENETVHHKNGVRTDNRIENLEIKVGAHTQGITIRDALSYADEIIDRYRPNEYDLMEDIW
jgi:HNH endonuclease